MIAGVKEFSKPMSTEPMFRVMPVLLIVGTVPEVQGLPVINICLWACTIGMPNSEI